MHLGISRATLYALHRKRSGTLISIDLPSYFETGPANRDGFDDTLPPEKEPGALGLLLPDSEHTHETMWSELTIVWVCVENSGTVVCDNVACNTLVFDFCRKVDRVPFLVSQQPKEPIRFGLIPRQAERHDEGASPDVD